MRLSCHSDDAFTADVLAQVQAAKVEEAMWFAMRTLRERGETLHSLTKRAKGRA